ncbi:PREDICTED: leucine-rich repeat-containing protein 34-like [Habropoda laboriosa]|uniref:leucine-rich repeat-containing protein 34-like n=1 Tax=Habropoda laboriosa TaxID=597456 RepID=UPI00083E1F8A|nr:PREDICTED: leucine-rich repeat-containing protein 34-like [Habropoda laboriosa]
MRGYVVYQKIRRNLQNVDIPALLIFLKDHQNITHITLANNNISDSGFISLLDHFVLYKNVEELDLQNNNIADLGIKYMLEVGKNLEIKSLNLGANKFGVHASKDVALFLLKNKYIHSLNVAEVNQTASSLIYFMMVLSSDQEISNGTLKSLNISRPNPGCMYYFDSVHFADVIGHMLQHNTTLKALHLQKYNFDCHDIESMMFNAIHNNSLHLLDLGCNNIGDHGINHIAKWLVEKPPLKTLILCRNIITDHGARSLSFAIPFSKLVSLDISYNKITDDGMVYILYTLKKFPMLRRLRIFSNCIGHPAAKSYLQILKRMLMSQVLQQENIDVRPYRVDHRWYFARYTGDCCKKGDVDVPYGLFSQMSKSPPVQATRPCRKYYKYTYSQTTKIDIQHVGFYIFYS